MRLYPRHSVGAIDSEFGRIEAQDDGGYDFPGPLAGQMHSIHIDGRQLWEDSIEQQRRLIQEDAARRADPRTLLDAVNELVKQSRTAPADPAETAPAKTPAKTTAAAKAPAAKTAAAK